MKDEDVVVISPLSRDFVQNGRSLKINIYRGTHNDDDWMLEVIDARGHSFVSNEMYVTDEAALKAAINTLGDLT